MSAFTDSSNDNPFTSYYAQLLHQGNMLQDHVRTSTYLSAFIENESDFKDKVVLDVGTGTGILAFFACRAGAKRVYAVEASDSVHLARKLAKDNGFADRVTIIQGKIEEVDLPEKVDVVISEPIGCLLVHERMLESYIIGRDRFLKKGGLMMPTIGTIICAPFTDSHLYNEQVNKANFWTNTNFYGVDLTGIADKAVEENLSQPIVGYFDSDILVSSSKTIHEVDFSSVTLQELQSFSINYNHQISKTSLCHGMACWFDILFAGSTNHITLSTAPDQPGTHWYQCRLLYQTPLAVNVGQTIKGVLDFEANDKFSYYIKLTGILDCSSTSSSNDGRDGKEVTVINPCINLHDQHYHYLYGTEA